MYEFREKRNLHKLLYSNVTLGVLLILVFLLARSTWNIYGKEQVAKAGRNQVDTAVASLQGRQTFLEKEINRLKTENGVEREIRGKFDVKKVGEEVAVIVDSTTTGQSSTDNSTLPERILGWLAGLFKK